MDRRVRSRKAFRLGGAVFSVGNLTIGGTGKTPWVLKLVRDLQMLGHTPAILTRGYKGVGQGFGRDSDEVMLMAEKCPGVPLGVGPDRIASALRLQSEHHPSVFVLDDGFQHWPLHRDVDIVCVDATDPWGKGFLIPYGRLREPVCALRRAHAVVLTRCDLVAQKDVIETEINIRRISPLAEIFRSHFFATIMRSDDNKERGPEELSGRRVLAVSGLGHPQGFELLLRRFGAEVTPMRFRDHHLYSDKDIDAINTALSDSSLILVTTEKDWVKLREKKLNTTCTVLKIEARLNDEDERRWKQFLKRKSDEAKISH